MATTIKESEVKQEQSFENKKEESIKQSNQKPIPYEPVSKLVESKGYKISINSFGGEWVRLPNGFNEATNGINIGKILEDRNKKSKKWGLDFSSYMGKEVAYIVCRMEKGTALEELIAFVADEKVVGAWTFVTDREQSGNDDHSILISNLERIE
jgi:hypothetical protein